MAQCSVHCLLSLAVIIIIALSTDCLPLLCQLHWLKAPERIAFKYAVLVYKCLHGSAPAYLIDELCQVADVEARQ